MKILNRIRFHLERKTMITRWELNPRFMMKESQRISAEIEKTEAIISPEEANKIEQMVAHHHICAPAIDPMKSALFLSNPSDHRCNILTAPFYRRRIRNFLHWGLAHEITTYVADYATPFGLLALETLMKEKKKNNSFLIYAARSTQIGKRRSYRMIKETGIELALLSAQADYHYPASPVIAVHDLFRSIPIHISECGRLPSKTAQISPTKTYLI